MAEPVFEPQDTDASVPSDWGSFFPPFLYPFGALRGFGDTEGGVNWAGNVAGVNFRSVIQMRRNRNEFFPHRVHYPC